MENLTDIPKYVRYDFFMAAFGMLVTYFVYTNTRFYEAFSLRVVCLILSGACLWYGILEMKRNYAEEKKLQQKEHAYRIERIFFEQLKVSQEIRLFRKQQSL